MAANTRSMAPVNIANFPSIATQNEKLNLLYRLTMLKELDLADLVKKLRDARSESSMTYLTIAQENVRKAHDVFRDFLQDCYTWVENISDKKAPSFTEGWDVLNTDSKDKPSLLAEFTAENRYKELERFATKLNSALDNSLTEVARIITETRTVITPKAAVRTANEENRPPRAEGGTERDPRIA